MGIFNPFVSSCEHERNLDWILKLVKNMPQKDEMLSALEEARRIASRADGLVKQVENVIDDATAAAEKNIRENISESIGRIEDAERNTLSKAQHVETVIDNATYIAKNELIVFVNEQLTEIRRLAESVSSDTNYVEQVVSDAATVLLNEIIQDINDRFSTGETALANNFSKALANLKEELDASGETIATNLSNHVEQILEQSKQELEETFNTNFEEVEEDVKSHVDDYVPHAVAQSFNERLNTCGVFIPVNSWNGKTAVVDTGMIVDTTTLFVTYSPTSFDDWYDNGVRCVGADGTFLEFECHTVPSAELYVYVVAIENIVYEE